MLALFAVAGCLAAGAQTAGQAWLGYPGASEHILFPRQIRALGSGRLEQSAVAELKRSLLAIFPTIDFEHGTHWGTARVEAALAGQTIVGTVEEVRAALPSLAVPADLEPEGYWIYVGGASGDRMTVIAGADQAGVLYGAFAFLRQPSTSDAPYNYDDHPLRSHPAMPIRWVDEWDNPDGSIERGYAGRSIFFEGGNVREDLAPVAEYARLLASVGINGCNVNNVNNAAPFLEPQMLQRPGPHGRRHASLGRPPGHERRHRQPAEDRRPRHLRSRRTRRVKAWWAAKVNEIYALIPDFAGFTVKADSEGQPGPASYGRTPADAANTLAAALAPHGGVVLYRAFVYNHHLDWRDPKADRARAAYDIFHPLDGKFAPNVIVQTKEGPIDFQAQEPVSPLFAGLDQNQPGHGSRRSRRSTPASSATSSTSPPCGSGSSTSTCA